MELDSLFVEFLAISTLLEMDLSSAKSSFKAMLSSLPAKDQVHFTNWVKSSSLEAILDTKQGMLSFIFYAFIFQFTLSCMLFVN